MEEHTSGQTVNLPILQDFDPIGAAALPTPVKTKEKVEQGKGTADHLMPLGYLFFILCLRLLFDGQSESVVDITRLIDQLLGNVTNHVEFT